MYMMTTVVPVQNIYFTMFDSTFHAKLNELSKIYHIKLGCFEERRLKV